MLRPARSFRRAVALLLGAPALLGACGGAPAVAIPRDAAGNPLPITVSLLELRAAGGPIRCVLSNMADKELLARAWGGKLPLWHKLISNRRMAELVAFLRARGFFRYAVPAPALDAGLPPHTRRVVAYRSGGGKVLRLVDVRGMGRAGRAEEVRLASQASLVIQQIANETLALRVDPRGRSLRELLRQPGLRRRSREAR